MVHVKGYKTNFSTSSQTLQRWSETIATCYFVLNLWALTKAEAKVILFLYSIMHVKTTWGLRYLAVVNLSIWEISVVYRIVWVILATIIPSNFSPSPFYPLPSPPALFIMLYNFLHILFLLFERRHLTMSRDIIGHLPSYCHIENYPSYYIKKYFILYDTFHGDIIY